MPLSGSERQSRARDEQERGWAGGRGWERRRAEVQRAAPRGAALNRGGLRTTRARGRSRRRQWQRKAPRGGRRYLSRGRSPRRRRPQAAVSAAPERPGEGQSGRGAAGERSALGQHLPPASSPRALGEAGATFAPIGRGADERRHPLPVKLPGSEQQGEREQRLVESSDGRPTHQQADLPVAFLSLSGFPPIGSGNGETASRPQLLLVERGEMLQVGVSTCSVHLHHSTDRLLQSPSRRTLLQPAAFTAPWTSTRIKKYWAFLNSCSIKLCRPQILYAYREGMGIHKI
ncbi:uncharacterized protein LOC110389106 [Numida meleagris]|uniref:uncharacterized protein LOC110389106 n=1 Tax=Numida meleagris TaxID=8996 RepID=UPI000B3DD695|nr:uncharacterized protein LOC110389106 [Numida meleagris]